MAQGDSDDFLKKDAADKDQRTTGEANADSLSHDEHFPGVASPRDAGSVEKQTLHSQRDFGHRDDMAADSQGRLDGTFMPDPDLENSVSNCSADGSMASKNTDLGLGILIDDKPVEASIGSAAGSFSIGQVFGFGFVEEDEVRPWDGDLSEFMNYVNEDEHEGLKPRPRRPDAEVFKNSLKDWLALLVVAAIYAGIYWLLIL